LKAFALYCLRNQINCITFNYDDLLDEALFKAARPESKKGGDPEWELSDGYGFHCQSSRGGPEYYYHKNSSVVLLKLHGSINWRIRRGYLPPYPVDAFVHDEDWSGLRLSNQHIADQDQLESEFFIVPPVLNKSALTEQPILRLLWSRAFDILSNAERVVFIGYSIPVTDIASFFLFSESLQHIADHSQISVINYAESSDEKTRTALRASYRAIFRRIKDGQFDFGGALEWAKQLKL
jgi:hypothetical protein